MFVKDGIQLPFTTTPYGGGGDGDDDDEEEEENKNRNFKEKRDLS